MRRLGQWSVMDSEPDSGHPTPRDNENFAEEGNGSIESSVSSPLTSTPVRERHQTSFRRFLEGSRKCHEPGDKPDAAIIVESVKQLIHTTEKNRRLTKENEKILNQSLLWHEEKFDLEKRLKDANMLSEAQRLEIKEKNDRIDLLEKQVAHLLKTIEEHPAEEVSEAAEKLIIEKKDVSAQCLAFDSEDYWQHQSLSKEIDYLREKCGFLENENCRIRREEEKLLKKCERLNEWISCFQTKSSNFSEIQSKNDELERLLSDAKMTIERQKEAECELKSRMLLCEQQVEELKCNDISMKQLVEEKVIEAGKLNEECAKLKEMSGKLTEENVSMTILNEELRMRLSRAHHEIEQLRSSVINERQARQTAEEASRQCANLDIKLREQLIQVDDLTSANEKMSAELDFLRQEIATATSKELERCSGALEECKNNLEREVAEKKLLLEKEEFYKEEITKLNSLRLELKLRDDTIDGLKLVEKNLRDSLINKSTELTELRDQLNKANYECSKIREEFRDFQESAEHQYCATVKEKCEIIEAISARLAQLESYPGQVLSVDDKTHGVYTQEDVKQMDGGAGGHTLYDCLSPALQNELEMTGIISNDVANAVKGMQSIYIPNESSEDTVIPGVISHRGVLCSEQRPRTSALAIERTQSPLCSLQDKEEFVLTQLVNSIDNIKDCNVHVGSPDVRHELKSLLISVMNDRSTISVESYVRRFLEGCDKQFLESATVLVSKETNAICDEKQSLEKKFSSEKLKWAVEREDMELQLDRYRREAEKVGIMRKEKAGLLSELNAAKVQIDQYRIKLRQKSEELEVILAERDVAAQLASEFRKLDQESQGQIREANNTIGKLEDNLREVRAQLESTCREMINLKDDNDANSIQIRTLRAQIADLERKIAELERRCEKLTKTERYNQKTIQIVCESFWEREEFIQRLKQRSYERKKLIEHFVEKVGDIISTFSGDPHPVETMHATIKSWTEADVKDELDNESREKVLHAKVVELGSGDQFDLARKRMANRSMKKP